MRKVQVLVQTRDGRKTIYELDRYGTVGSLKARIGRDMTVPMGFSRLSYKGRVLANHSVLEDVCGNKMSILDLTWEPIVLTPKQVSETDGESVSSKVEPYGQMVKSAVSMHTFGSFQNGDDANGGIVNPTDQSSPRNFHADDDDYLDDQDPNCASSDGLEFFSNQPSFQKCDDLSAANSSETALAQASPLDSLDALDPLDLAKDRESCTPTKGTAHKKKAKKHRKNK